VTRLASASPRRMAPAWRMLATNSSKSFFLIPTPPEQGGSGRGAAGR
jgi:hypothetical protein